MSVSCPVCGKRLSNKYNLRIHIRDKHETHESSRPTCATCCRTFKNANSLRVHSIKQHGHISNRRRLRAAAAAAAMYQHHRHYDSFAALNTAITTSMQSRSNTLYNQEHNSDHQRSSANTIAANLSSHFHERSFLQSSLAATDTRSNNNRLRPESLGQLFNNRRLTLDEDVDEGHDEVETLLNSIAGGGGSKSPYASCQSHHQTNSTSPSTSSSSNNANATTTSTLTPAPFGGPPPHLQVEEPSPRLTSPAFREKHPQQ